MSQSTANAYMNEGRKKTMEDDTQAKYAMGIEDFLKSKHDLCILISIS